MQRKHVRLAKIKLGMRRIVRKKEDGTKDGRRSYTQGKPQGMPFLKSGRTRMKGSVGSFRCLGDSWTAKGMIWINSDYFVVTNRDESSVTITDFH